MEFFGLLVVLILVGVLILVVVVADLRNRVTVLEALDSARGTASEAPRRVPEPAVAITPARVPVEPTPEILRDAKASALPAVNWEIFAGGRFFNWIGAIALVLGVGMFFKYAFDNNMIGPVARIILGVAGGIALLAAGTFFQMRDRKWFAQGLLGAGLGILYLSGYAAFESYHLVPFAVAYAFMSLVTVIAFALAARFDALPMMLIGAVGGFVTPFALDEIGTNEIALASYLILLDLGVLAVAYVKRDWEWLQWPALIATWIASSVWFNQHLSSESWLVSTIALLTFWATFFSIALLVAARKAGSHFALSNFQDAANVLFTVASLYWVLHGRSDALQIVLLLMAAVYGVTFALTARHDDWKVWRAQSYIVAAGLIAAFLGEHSHGLKLATMLAFEGFALVGIEALARRIFAGYRAPETLYVASLLALAPVVAYDARTEWMTYLGTRVDLGLGGIDLSFAASIATLSAVALVFKRNLDGAPNWLGAFRQLMLLCVLLDIGLHVHSFGLAAVLGVVALLCAERGTALGLLDLQVDAIVITAIAAIGMAMTPNAFHYEHIFTFDPLHNARLFSQLALGATTIGIGMCFITRGLVPDWLARTVRALGIVGIVGATMIEIGDIFQKALANARLESQTAVVLGEISRLTNGEQLAFTAILVAGSLVLVALGFSFRVRDLRLLALGFFYVAIVKTFFVDLSGLDMPFRIAAFIGLGLILMAVSFLYQRLERRLADDPGSPSLASSEIAA